MSRKPLNKLIKLKFGGLGAGWPGPPPPFKIIKNSNSKNKKVYSYTLLGGGEFF